MPPIIGSLLLVEVSPYSEKVRKLY